MLIVNCNFMFDFNFPGQREGEDVLAVIYKHPIVYTRIIAGFFILIILPITVFCKIWFYFYPLASFYEKGVIVGIFASLVFLSLMTCSIVFLYS